MEIDKSLPQPLKLKELTQVKVVDVSPDKNSDKNSENSREKDAQFNELLEAYRVGSFNEENVDESCLGYIINDLNRHAQAVKRELKFSISKSSKELSVEILDRDTNKLVRQMSPEEIAELHNQMCNFSENLAHGNGFFLKIKL